MNTSNTKRIYIAGKVTGLPYGEVQEKFSNYKLALQAQGHEPINPLDICKENDAWHVALRKCIAALCACDEIHMLPDWMDSRGARLELTVANDLEIKIVYL